MRIRLKNISRTLALLWDRSVTHEDRENSEGNVKSYVLADDVYEALLDLVVGKAQPPVKERTRAIRAAAVQYWRDPAEGYQLKKTMLVKRYITRGVEC